MSLRKINNTVYEEMEKHQSTKLGNVILTDSVAFISGCPGDKHRYCVENMVWL